jgi:diaminopimelate epimerase
MATSLVGHYGPILMAISSLNDFAALAGAPFTKMTGSGNDFVVFDGREVSLEAVTQPEVIRAICDRHNGIGADGIVVLSPSSPHAVDSGGREGRSSPLLLKYFNRDGTLGELCGNATLCSTALAVRHGLAPADDVRLHTDAGPVRARVVAQEPEIDIAPVFDIRGNHADTVPHSAEHQHVGYARVGVPHIVIVLPDQSALDAVDVGAKGRPLRQPAPTQPEGANVNWVAPLSDGRWAYRTYERGVEDETLACGTGAIAAAILLTTWGLAHGPVTLLTRSGRPLTVTLRAGESTAATGRAAWLPSLRGEGRVVFRGTLEALPPTG